MVFGGGDEINFRHRGRAKFFLEARGIFPRTRVFIYAPSRRPKLRAFLQLMSTLLAPLAVISLEGLGAMALYALVGIVLAILGYKLFDRCTPGDMHEEIIKNRNP